MASLTNFCSRGVRNSTAKILTPGNNECSQFFDYCVIDQLVLEKVQRPFVAGPDQTKFDEQNREAVMLIKLLVTDDQLPQIPSSYSDNHKAY